MSDEFNGSICHLHSWQTSKPYKYCPTCQQAEIERDELKVKVAELEAELHLITGSCNNGWSQFHKVQDRIKAAEAVCKEASNAYDTIMTKANWKPEHFDTLYKALADWRSVANQTNSEESP